MAADSGTHIRPNHRPKASENWREKWFHRWHFQKYKIAISFIKIVFIFLETIGFQEWGDVNID
jgi:hypothetical protein